MEHEQILNALLRIIHISGDEEGRLSMSEANEQLHQRGAILSIADEVISLRELLHSEDFSRCFNITPGDESHDAVITLTDEGKERLEKLNAERYQRPKNLFTWAFMSSFDSALGQLAEMALPENWDDGDAPFGILKSYISNTFARLLYEKREKGNERAIVEGEKWAAFNTGLVNRLYDPIYALFSLNKKTDMQKWVFHSWCTPGNKRAGQVLSRFFEQLPSKAVYFTNPSQLIYDGNAGAPTLPFEHILDRLSRLPMKFLERYAPPGVQMPAEGEEPQKEFYDSYKAALLSEEGGLACLHFKDALELSLRRAVKRVAWNYRLAIPVYDAKRRTIMLLLPMSLDTDTARDTVDVALVVERAKGSGRYLGHTILTLDMSYKKARMIMRPESDWLFGTTQTTMAKHLHEESVDTEERELADDLADTEAAQRAADRAAEAAKAAEDAGAQEAEEAASEAASEAGDQAVAASDAFLYQHENDEIFTVGPKLNVLGTVDLTGLDSGRNRRKSAWGEEEPQEALPQYMVRGMWRPEDGDINIQGQYYEGFGKGYVMVGKSRFEARELTDEGLIDGDDVVFDIKTEDNRWKKGRTFFFAVNIRLADE